LVRVAGLPQGNGVNFVHVPGRQGGKGFLGIVFHVFPQQGVVIQFLHLPINAANGEMWTLFLRQLPGKWEFWTNSGSHNNVW
jgi:hypothetical protein